MPKKRSLSNYSAAARAVFLWASLSLASPLTNAESTLFADVVYKNGVIVTMKAEGDSVESVATAEGKIIAAGKESDVDKLVTRETEIIDLQGQTLLPGFIDTHGHFFYTAEYAYGWVDINSKPVGTVESIDDIIELLKQRAKVTPVGEWILGWGYDHNNLKEKRHPNRKDLDRVSTKHPIYLQHLSGWYSTANSLALATANITSDTIASESDTIFLDPDLNTPTGVIESAQSPTFAAVPKTTEEDYFEALRVGSALYLAAGVTTAQEGWGDINQWEVLNRAVQADVLTVRTVFWPLAQGNAQKDLGRFPVLTSGTAVDSKGMLVLGANKITADGSMLSDGAFLSNAYHQQRGHLEGYRGKPTHEQEKLTTIVMESYKNGRQVAIHGNGDSGIDYILTAIERAQKAHPEFDDRPIIVHSSTVRDDQLERMQRIGAIPSFFSGILYYWGDLLHDTVLGPDRANRMYPARSAVYKGLKFTLHNDTYVTPIDPLMAVWSAVNRRSLSGLDLGKEQQGVTVYQALEGVTSSAAFQGFEEHSKGSIEVGKLADFVVLEQNPLTIDSMAIKDIAVRATIVGGDVVFGQLLTGKVQ